MNKELNLRMQNGRYFCVNYEYLKEYEDAILTFLDGNKYMETLEFAKKVLFNEEIKFNNNIEGINDGIEFIDNVINQVDNDNCELEKKRIINLYKGYKYILENKEINKENLKELYDILSDGLIDYGDKIRMGEYYRNGSVNILRGGHLVSPYMGISLADKNNPYLGVNSDKIDELMNLFFEYVNSDNDEVSVFVKSQIMHFYFVYIHPYFDVNGRTSRTVSMWFLLNNHTYPYIIFNRAIAFSEKAYSENIIKGKVSGDITLFLKYMLLSVLRALEREYLINNIDANITKEEAQILECFLSLNGEHTVKDLAIVYNSYNNVKKIKEVYFNKVLPLINKGIFLNLGETKSYIANDIHNIRLAIDAKKVHVDAEKVKHLSINRYVK